MKLRNKKTGEIVDHIWFDSEIEQLCVNGERMKFYDSLAELNEEWEDAPEEPKEYWFIGYDAQVECISENDSDGIELDKSIGNYFETKEEAEKAVEKLKAWKRLKDKEFRFELWDYDGGNVQEKIRTGRILFRVADDYPENNIDKDLDLLFSREDS